MKKLIIAFSTALLLAPLAPASAQDSTVSGSANANVEVNASTTRPQKPHFLPSSLPKLGPVIKNIASTTRAKLQGAATTTKEAAKMRVDAIHNAITDRNKNLRNLLQEKREMLENRAEMAKEKARERFGETVQKHIRIIVERLTAAVERLTNIAARLESRIEKLQSEGHDTTNSVTLLAEAEVAIEAAHDAVANVSVVLETALSSTTPREHIGKVREAIQKAKETLKDAKDALKEVLRSIKVEVQ